MKTIIVFFIGISVAINLFSQTSTAYQMKKVATDSILISRDLSADEVISLTTLNNEISSLSISGNITLFDNTSLLRIILKTTQHEFLVYEAYPLICEDKTLYIDKICEETGLLNEVTPVELKIIVRNAMFEFNKIHYSTQSISPIESGNFNSITLANKKIIEKEKATTINFNNSKLQKTWFADTIKTAFLPFEKKKILFGGNDDYDSYGFDYYSAGIFSFPDFDPNTAERSQSKTTYVTSFDWRDRHGKNWITSIKDQAPCNSCCVFSAIAATEAMFNIYYNDDNIDLDLSEQHIGSCCPSNLICGKCSSGCFDIGDAIVFIRDSGVCDEGCFPFVEYDTPCSNKCSTPDEIVRITTKQDISSTSDALKHAIINIGPLSGKIPGHAMALIGFNEICAGDTIQYTTSTGMHDSIIDHGNPLIGLTYWIFKNSYGIRQPGQWYYHANQGYVYVFVQYISQISAKSGEVPYSTINTYTRKCTDNDNDGYYSWGIGSKPATCPSCSPNTPDCDDSDPLIGPIDEYGNCTVITEPYEAAHDIYTTVTWSNTSICGDVFVHSGGNLTIDNTDVNIYNEFSVEIGGTLTITEGEIK